MAPDRRATRRARALVVGAVVCLAVVAVVGLIAGTNPPRDRVDLSTGTPSDEPAPPDVRGAAAAPEGRGGPSSTTTSQAPPTTVPRVFQPGIDDRPSGPGDSTAMPPTTQPEEEPPPLPEIARGTQWAPAALPPHDPRYLVPQGPVPVRGTVRGPGGSAAGMCVELVSLVDDGHLERATTKTDGAGRFSTSVPNGVYAVRAHDCRGVAPGLGSAVQYLAIAPGQEGQVDLEVGPGAGLRVTVTTPSGAPRAGWCVTQISEAAIWRTAHGGVRTGSDGVAVLGGLEPGRSRIVATPDCDWANQRDGAASEQVHLPAGQTGTLALAPWSCVTTAPGHQSCSPD